MLELKDGLEICKDFTGCEMNPDNCLYHYICENNKQIYTYWSKISTCILVGCNGIPYTREKLFFLAKDKETITCKDYKRNTENIYNVFCVYSDICKNSIKENNEGKCCGLMKIIKYSKENAGKNGYTE